MPPHKFITPSRRRLHETHVPLDHTAQLRQFIKAVFVQELTQWGNAGVVLDLKDRAGHLVVPNRISVEIARPSCEEP